MRKFKSKKGFTLAELLVVVAIIAALVAVAVPIFSAQLEKSREAVDMANARAANSMAMTDYLTNHSDVKDIDYIFAMDQNGNLEVISCTLSQIFQCTLPEHLRFSDPSYNWEFGKSKKCKNLYGIAVTIENGKITSNSFLDELG